MGCSIIIPIFGLVGYYCGIDWLFCLAGGLTVVIDFFLLAKNGLFKFSSILIIVSWMLGIIFLSPWWKGLFYGACTATILLTGWIVIPLLLGALAAVWNWLKSIGTK